MIRRAEWRRLPKDPRSPIGWFLHGSRGTAIALTATVGFFAICAALSFQFGLTIAFLLCFVAPWFFVYMILMVRSSFKLYSVSTLGAKPEPAETFPIEFSVHEDGVCTGRDRGIATLVGGWLHVEGLHTTFSLRPVDIAGTSSMRESRGGLILQNGQTIRITSMAWGRGNREAFSAALRSWRHFPFELPKGEPLFPPRRVHGSAIAQPVFALLTSFLAVAGTFGVMSWMFFTHGSLSFATPLLVFVSMQAYLIHLARHQVAYLLRLRRVESKALSDFGEA